jgi:hypothetical protein
MKEKFSVWLFEEKKLSLIEEVERDVVEAKKVNKMSKITF